MVAQLDEHSLELVVQGLQGLWPTLDLGAGGVVVNRSRGIVSCRLQKTDRYDHKRHHALGQAAVADDLKIWDFVLECEDGTLVFLHASYSNTKIECRRGEPERDHELPANGPGGSNGAGTFRSFTQRQVQATLRFDCNKYSSMSRYFRQGAASSSS